MIVTMTALLAVIARDYKGIGSTGIADDKSYAMYAGMAGLAISLSLSVTQVTHAHSNVTHSILSLLFGVNEIIALFSNILTFAFHLPTPYML